MLRVFAALLLLLAFAASGSALLSQNSPRDVGEHFADALENRSDTPFENYLAADAVIYLQGAAVPMTKQAFRVYVERMKTSQQLFHRVGQVYITPSGVGWPLGITRGTTEAAPSLWMEAAMPSGQISRIWIHFTLETLQALHRPPSAYVARMASLGLPLPDAWADGTLAMITAAERYDANQDGAQLPRQPLVLMALFVVGASLVFLFLAKHRPRQIAPHSAGQRHRALLQSRRMRRTHELPGTSISVQGLSTGVTARDTD